MAVAPKLPDGLRKFGVAHVLAARGDQSAGSHVRVESASPLKRVYSPDWVPVGVAVALFRDGPLLLNAGGASA